VDLVRTTVVNRRAPSTGDPALAPREAAPPLDRLAALTEEEFGEMFRSSPVSRARYAGFLRNVAVAIGNSGNPGMVPALAKLAEHPSELVREHARWALWPLDQALDRVAGTASSC